jgi:hypothetical protein
MRTPLFMMNFWSRFRHWLINLFSTLLNKDTRACLPAVFFLALILSIASCTKQESTLGVNVLPGEDELNAASEIFNVNTVTRKRDDLRTDTMRINHLGRYIDPEFGDISASFSAQFFLPETGTIQGSVSSIRVDSLVLSIAYSSLYGTAAAQSVKVYELDQVLSKDSIYFASSSVSILPDPVGEKINFTPVLTDTSLRIPLSIALGQKIVNIFKGGVTGNSEFVGQFKGLHLRPEFTPVAGQGGLTMYDLLSDFTQLTLYYYNTDDGQFYTYSLNVPRSAERFNTYNINNTGYPVGAAIDNPQASAQRVFVQSIGGIGVEVKIPDFFSRLGEGNTVINKANLIVPVEGGFGAFVPPAQLYIYGIDSSGIRRRLPEFFDQQFLYKGAQFSPQQGAYIFDVTSYIQFSLLQKQDFGLYLLPHILPFEAGVNPSRGVLKGGSADNPMRLQIIYTKP